MKIWNVTNRKEENLSDVVPAAARKRIAEWNKIHRTMYDGMKFVSRSEEFIRDYAERGASSFLGPKPLTAEEQQIKDAKDRAWAAENKRRNDAFWAHMEHLRQNNIREAIFAGQALTLSVILELSNGQQLIDEGIAKVAEYGSAAAAACIGSPEKVCQQE